jgi:hypothetical protein
VHQLEEGRAHRGLLPGFRSYCKPGLLARARRHKNFEVGPGFQAPCAPRGTSATRSLEEQSSKARSRLRLRPRSASQTTACDCAWLPVYQSLVSAGSLYARKIGLPAGERGARGAPVKGPPRGEALLCRRTRESGKHASVPPLASLPDVARRRSPGRRASPLARTPGRRRARPAQIPQRFVIFPDSGHTNAGGAPRSPVSGLPRRQIM